uniref:RNase H type-1 domain-containing protein n=1 Tax=Heterosigma akashiwo TaxID=2829 RepID=A0A7S3Y6K3_HETAK|mmetsp:Transcript_1755/g.3485  ORF Transcript_1755/g.3485 Transcript_1755/m.3485 type:complete len:111 (+) Transcript_1755:47-379(+)
MVEASGLFRLPDYCTMYQAEAVELREAQVRVEKREGRRLMASDSRAVLPSMSGQSHMTTLVAEITDGARAGDLYIPGHQGCAGNEKADELAKVAVEMQAPCRFREHTPDN